MHIFQVTRPITVRLLISGYQRVNGDNKLAKNTQHRRDQVGLVVERKLIESQYRRSDGCSVPNTLSVTNQPSHTCR